MAAVGIPSGQELPLGGRMFGVSPILPLLVLITAQTAAVSAQATRAPYTEGSVWNLQFIRVKPGLQDDYLKVRECSSAEPPEWLSGGRNC